MCGIAGIFAYGESAPPADRDELLLIRDHMIARGPDGAGLWLSSDLRMGLAHRRLAIIELSGAGAQPMLDSDTGNRIVFNGEIYNYKELRAELKAVGQRFVSSSDTEVLLKLYAVHGQAMLHKLRGMYAFALWDSTKQGVFLARDPFGIKPLYLADDGKSLRFASQVKALLAGGAVDTAADPAGHVGLFLWGHLPEPYTLYRGIRALPAGTSLWLDTARNKVQKTHFNLAEEVATPKSESWAMSSSEAQEILRDALKDSIRHHLVADVPVGVFLSSGLDSATITALACEVSTPFLSGAPLRTLTLGFNEFAGAPSDEVPGAGAVARHYGTQHVTRRVNRQEFESRLAAVLDAMDQPSVDGINSYFISLASREAGLKVALSGLGGDEIFAGYSSFTQIPRMVRLLSPVASLPGIGRGFRYVAAPLLKHHTSPKYAGLLEYGSTYAGAYLLRRGLFMPWELPAVLDGDIVKEGWRTLQTLPALRQTMDGIDNPRLRVSALEAAWYMRNQLLRDTDWASMAHSLEVRVPLVDIDLFRTVTRLVHAGHAPSKEDMASSPANRPPAQLFGRPKTGFSVPVQDWLIQPHSAPAKSSMRGLRGWLAVILRHTYQAGT